MVALHLIEFELLSAVARQLQNALHAPGFGLVAIGIMLMLRPTTNVRTAYVTALISALTIGAVSEALQFFSSRNADIADLGRDAIGIVGFLAAAAFVDPQVRHQLSRGKLVAILALGVAASMLSLVPAARNTWILSLRVLAVPVIASFDNTWETEFYRPLDITQLSMTRTPAEWPIRGGRVLAINFAPIRFSGITIDAYPDWTNYRTISFLAVSADGQEHDIVVRIHDAEHNSRYNDRFNRVIRVGTSVERHVIAFEDIQNDIKARAFDFSRVAGIIIFKVDAAGDERILIDDIRLDL